MKRVHLLFLTFLFCAIKVDAQFTEPLISPYNALYNHLENLQTDNYYPELSARSFSGIQDSTSAIDAAIKLKRVMDGSGLYLIISQVPKDVEHIDSLSQKEVYYPFRDELPYVFLEKSDGEWRYSEITVEHLDEMFKTAYPLGLHRIIDLLPANQGPGLFGVFLWQIIGIVVLLMALWLVYYVLKSIFDFIIKRLVNRWVSADSEVSVLIGKMDRYLVMYILASLFIKLVPLLKLPIRFSVFLQVAGRIMSAVFIMMLALKAIDILKVYLRRVASSTDNRMDEQLLPIVIKFLKVIIVIFTIFHVLSLLNVNVTALIAGISIGGLALALAAQDTVKNLIGSMMIFFDRPFQIGDYIVAGGIEGSVEEVGFRSTRIRKSDTSVTAIPNGTIANQSLTNLGVRKMRLFNPPIGLMYNSSSDKIQAFIEGLRNLADSHHMIHPYGKYIHLKGLSDSSIDIFFKVYIDTNAYAEELKIKEELTFSIMKIAEEVGVSFAFPSTSVYIEQMPGK